MFYSICVVCVDIYMIQVQDYSQSYNNFRLKSLQNQTSKPSFGMSYEEPADNSGGLEITALSALALQALSSSLDSGTRWLANKLAKGKEFTSAENVKRVANDMVKNNNLDVTVKYIAPENVKQMTRTYGYGLENDFKTVAAGQNAFFSSENKLAVAPQSKPSLIAHELGHAVNAKSKFWSALQKSRRYTPYAPLAALLLSKFLPNKDGSPNFVERNAGLLGFAAYLPTIIEEGKASLRGLSQAKTTLANEIKSGKINLNALKRNYAVAWLTYVLAGVGLGIATKYSIIEDKLVNGSKRA